MSRQLLAWETEERKLQSVYDDISLHRIVPAQQTIARYLKKHPKSQPALIINMYIMQKTGAEESDVLQVYKQIQALAGPKKEMTGRGVWWCTLTLRNMGRLDLAQQVYQDLYDLHPETYQLLEQLFFHSAAAWDVSTMVTSSRKMFNATRDPKWARLAAWAEWVQKAPQPTPSDPFPCPASPNSLKIAQVLLSTTGNTCDTSEIFWLRAQILLSSDQPGDLLKLARQQAQEGSLARLWWRMETVKAAMARCGKEGQNEWETEREWVTEMLEKDNGSQRNYAFYQYLLLATQNSTGPDSVQSTVSLLESLTEQIGQKERAPQLAQLEFDVVLHSAKIASEMDISSNLMNDEEWLDQVEQYWNRWGSKGSIVTELIAISRESEKRKAMVVNFLKARAAQQHHDETSFKEVSNAHTILLMEKDADWMPTDEDIEKYWRLYLEGLRYGVNLAKTDVQSSDSIGLLTVNLLVLRWHSSPKNMVPLYKSILCLEKICRESPICMHAHYLLIRLYRLIGAASLIGPHLTALGLSEIQLDNLLHITVERGAIESLVTKNVGIWLSHTDKAVNMYQRTASDFPEYVKECLSNETYSKITSIKHLASSLHDSLSSHVVAIEQARLHVFNSPTVPFPPQLTRRLQKSLKAEVIDLRNWDLIQEIGGKRKLTKDITELGGRPIEDNWVKTMGRFWLAVGEFIKSGEVVDLELEDLDALLDHERALLESGYIVLKAASKALKPSAEIAESEEQEKSLKGIFSENIRICCGDHASRWSLIQSCISLAQLIKITDLVFSRAAEAAKPVKGKKKPTQLSAFIADLRNEIQNFKTSIVELNSRLDAVRSEDEVKWDCLNILFREDVYLQDIFDNLINARKAFLDSLKPLLSTKK
uniref:N-terminal acetyltransferase B complex subunit MDM20 n=1 Tax=Cryptococcus bacillisporus CA1280 TaxID=1296109 RepID=A0A0D0VTL4_CRYGA|nr:hypothetical protein I312_00916 [Cryptococcus bacillisporus CA1280]